MIIELLTLALKDGETVNAPAVQEELKVTAEAQGSKYVYYGVPEENAKLAIFVLAWDSRESAEQLNKSR